MLFPDLSEEHDTPRTTYIIFVLEPTTLKVIIDRGGYAKSGIIGTVTIKKAYKYLVKVSLVSPQNIRQSCTLL